MENKLIGYGIDEKFKLIKNTLLYLIEVCKMQSFSLEVRVIQLPCRITMSVAHAFFSSNQMTSEEFLQSCHIEPCINPPEDTYFSNEH